VLLSQKLLLDVLLLLVRGQVSEGEGGLGDLGVAGLLHLTLGVAAEGQCREGRGGRGRQGVTWDIYRVIEEG